ncbi:low quality protein: interstitial [Lynx pardinus]|nr:low quality protein: interstitial [Lynx pardinus]
MGGGVHFDEEKTWTDDFRNYNLYYVAAHELGHSLGLLHSDDIGSLMFPRYIYYGDALLSPKDIDAIQAIYGEHKVKMLDKQLGV